jgi:hypothetical protein
MAVRQRESLRSVQAPARSRPRKARPPLRVVEGKGKGRRRSPIPVVAAVVLTVFGVAALHATMSQDGLKAAKLEREVADETERLTLLRARVAQLSNPARVADQADKFGLVGTPELTFLKVPLPDGTDSLRRTGTRPLPPDPIKKLNSR